MGKVRDKPESSPRLACQEVLVGTVLGLRKLDMGVEVVLSLHLPSNSSQAQAAFDWTFILAKSWHAPRFAGQPTGCTGSYSSFGLALGTSRLLRHSTACHLPQCNASLGRYGIALAGRVKYYRGCPRSPVHASCPQARSSEAPDVLPSTQAPRRREGLAIGPPRPHPYTNPFDLVDGSSRSPGS
jgi:hypothetical protein